jgi:acetyl-CoA acetyltransferase
VETPGAQFCEPITVEDVMASRPIATPLKLLDCCPVSDGGAAIVVSAERPEGAAVKIIGAGQAHLHQHVSELRDVAATGAAISATRALDAAGVPLDRIGYAAIYDSFTITLTMLLEEIGVAPRGQAAVMARAGEFEPGGRLPLNTHGGLLSYGHCGVAGAMAHLVEAHRQMSRRAGSRGITPPDLALVHGDGGVLSSHVSLVLERVR